MVVPKSRQSTSYFRGVRPNYLASARILEDQLHAPAFIIPCETPGRTHDLQGVHHKREQRYTFYVPAFPAQPPTYSAVKVPRKSTTRGYGRSNRAPRAAACALRASDSPPT